MRRVLDISEGVADRLVGFVATVRKERHIIHLEIEFCDSEDGRRRAEHHYQRITKGFVCEEEDKEETELEPEKIQEEMIEPRNAFFSSLSDWLAGERR